MKRLLLISDLWGQQKSSWLAFYISKLKHHFDVHYYDACELGNIDLSIYEEKHIHQQFINGGIELAVTNLLKQEKQRVHLLTFSIGGTIGWQAIQQGLLVHSFHAISATRLRYQKEKIDIPTRLIYGADDPFRPSDNWFEQHHCVEKKIIPRQGHDLYTFEKIAQFISQEMILDSQ